MKDAEEIVSGWSRFPLPTGPFEYENSMTDLRVQCARVLEMWMTGRRRNAINPWVPAADEVVDIILTRATSGPIFSEIRRQQARLHAAVETLQEVVLQRVAIEKLISEATSWSPEKFADRIPINGSHFVYLLYRSLEKNPVYVGETASVFRRIGQHINDSNKHFDEVAILEYRNKKEAQECERRLIVKLQPEYNVKGTGKPYRKTAA